MNIKEEIRSLSRISENFRKNKKPKSKWPVEFQLRVLRLIEEGYSPTALSKKLNIPVQTYYHWRRLWKNAPKKNFIELPAENHDILKSSSPTQKHTEPSAEQKTGSATIHLPGGAVIESVSLEIIFKVLQDAFSS